MDSKDKAALYWFADLKTREVSGWQKATRAIKSLVATFVGHGPDVADLIIVRHDTREIIYSRPAGDATHAHETLVSAKRDLSEMTRAQFATEWSQYDALTGPQPTTSPEPVS